MNQQARRMKVLVVEDDEISRTIVTTVTSEAGYEVREACNGVEALSLFESFQPDLVFSDISMPEMDGLQLLEKIRKKSHDVIVIMTTGHGTAEYTLKALQLHANDYLVKPIPARDLLAALTKYEDVVASRSIEREVLGLILHRELTMRMGNRPEIAAKVADRLLLETEGRIPLAERLGIRLGLVEIILNAIEHGNLAITYEEKTRALNAGPDGFLELVERRMEGAPYKDRSVLIRFLMDGDRCEWMITDDGDGFDWANIPDPNDPQNLLAMHGRGLLMTRLNFDEVVFEGRGNRVTLRKRISHP